MPKTDPYPDHAKREVGNAVSRYTTGGLVLPSTKYRMEEESRSQVSPSVRTLIEEDRLTEVFAVWIINENLMGAATRVSDAAYDSNTWHHQVSRRVAHQTGTAKRIVGSVQSELINGSSQVLRITLNDNGLGQKVEERAVWIEQNIGDPEVLVRLIIVPSRYIHCFWLAEPNRDWIVVISAPRGYEALKIDTVYSFEEFVSIVQSVKVARKR
jgi:hypothetical protein